jgi:hypothetical protein
VANNPVQESAQQYALRMVNIEKYFGLVRALTNIAKLPDGILAPFQVNSCVSQLPLCSAALLNWRYMNR